MGATIVACLATLGGSAFANSVLLYHSPDRAASAGSPFGFVNGANYATVHGSGFLTNSYANSQQLSVTVSTLGADGAYGTYAIDVLDVKALVTSGTTWTLEMAVRSPLTGTGANAAYLFYCTVAPGGVPASGTPIASGVDSLGNPWAILAPTCAGTSGAVSLLTSSAGAIVRLSGITTGTTVLYCSFGIDVTSTGASTTAPASVELLANA